MCVEYAREKHREKKSEKIEEKESSPFSVFWAQFYKTPPIEGRSWSDLAEILTAYPGHLGLHSGRCDRLLVLWFVRYCCCIELCFSGDISQSSSFVSC